MPAPAPPIGFATERALRALGEKLRVRRKALRLTTVATSEAAGLSRVTLHRIERGESSVAMGSYASVIHALGLQFELRDPKARSPKATRLPRRIRLSEFPQLKKLAWQLQGKQELTPEEALNLYERNWRHLEPEHLNAAERNLLDGLLQAFGRERLLV